MSEDLRRVWSATLPWKYAYEDYIPAFTRSLPIEVMELKNAWEATAVFHYFEIWDSEKDPILVGVNPMPEVDGGLLAMAINGTNGARRLLGDQSRNTYTLLAQWAEHETITLDGEEMLAAVKRDSLRWVAMVCTTAAGAFLALAVAASRGMVGDPDTTLSFWGGVIVFTVYMMTTQTIKAGRSAQRLLSEFYN